MPSKCYSKAEAAKLPPSVFHCSPDAGYPQVAPLLIPRYAGTGPA